ncbi:MAG: response regulator transcription factor [Acidobacteriota bacterium]|nr:response regulator transcription factor [Acidobacteriota bacterium]
MTAAKILLADDHEIVRRGLRALLEGHPDWAVVGEAETGREAVEMARDVAPDVAILDIGMPELNGFEATRQILKAAPQTEVLILTMHESEQIVREVLDAGARGYVLKSDAGRDLVAAVEALCQHRTFFSSKIADMLLHAYLRPSPRPNGEPEPARGRLTAREREIVQLLAEGKSNKEVAQALNISIKTAETHRTNIMNKLDLRSITALVRYAVRNNIVEP